MLESVVVRSALNGARLPVITVGATEACFFDTLGDLDGDGAVLIVVALAYRAASCGIVSRSSSANAKEK